MLEKQAEREARYIQWYPERYLVGYPEMQMDDHSALVTERDLKRLPEYSASIPTGLYVGKCWKAGDRIMENGKLIRMEWYLRFVTVCDPPQDGLVMIHTRKLLVV